MKKRIIVSLLLIGIVGSVYWGVIYGGIESGIIAIVSLTFLICALFADSTTGTFKIHHTGDIGTTHYHIKGKSITNNKRKETGARREVIIH